MPEKRNFNSSSRLSRPRPWDDGLSALGNSHCASACISTKDLLCGYVPYMAERRRPSFHCFWISRLFVPSGASASAFESGMKSDGGCFPPVILPSAFLKGSNNAVETKGLGWGFFQPSIRACRFRFSDGIRASPSARATGITPARERYRLIFAKYPAKRSHRRTVSLVGGTDRPLLTSSLMLSWLHHKPSQKKDFGSRSRRRPNLNRRHTEVFRGLKFGPQQRYRAKRLF